MTALQITDLRTFMTKLLGTHVFDDFLLQEVTLQMGISYVIDGHINEAFYQIEDDADSPVERASFITYREVRHTLFDLIKGKRTPLGLQMVLQLPPAKAAQLFPEGLETHMIKGLLMNIRYDGTKALITSGISYHSFTLDKTPELIWDEALIQFLRASRIVFEQL